MGITDQIAEEYLWCRDVMHSWDPYNARVSRNKVTRRNEVHQVLLCTRCGTFKTRVLTTSGDYIRSSYVHPDGYLLKHRVTPADRSEIRRHNIEKYKKAAGDK